MAGQGIVWGNEMRLGLRGQVRKVWAPGGRKVVPTVQIGWSDTYVVARQHERRGDGPYLGGLGRGAPH